MRCIIVEDEPLAMERTRAYVERVPFLALAGCYASGLEALAALQEQVPDLILLDVNLGDLSGIELLEAARPKAEVILTTAYDQYALKGYELQVTDYLLKPYTFERFLQAIVRAKANLEQRMPAATQARDFLFVKTEYRLEQVRLADIVYIEGMRDYRRLHLAGGRRIMTLQTFAHFEQELPPEVVCRVHKSYMVALARIEAVERDRIRIGGMTIPVSESYRKAFYARIES